MITPVKYLPENIEQIFEFFNVRVDEFDVEFSCTHFALSRRWVAVFWPQSGARRSARTAFRSLSSQGCS
jgi:hypothetical protein